MQAGTKVGGRYVISRLLGQGGMANVYLADDLILNRPVAIKFLRIGSQNDPSAVRRFQREAMATTELDHPNIVQIYDIGTQENQPYFVMEYIDGQDLRKYIRDNHPIDGHIIQQMMLQILSAVDLAHHHQIIHRDLKPQNIMINSNGDIKITDFGIAVVLNETSLTQTNSLLGSVHYISPEQARGAQATTKSDIYSLGIILYEMMVGKVPFEGDTAVAIALKHFNEPIPDIHNKRLDLPQSLVNVMLKATDKEPLNRYANCMDMARDLETVYDASRQGESIYHQTMEEKIDYGKTLVAPFPSGQIDEALASEKTGSPFTESTPSRVTIASYQEDKDKDKTPLVGSKEPKKKKTLWLWLLLLGGIGMALVFAMINPTSSKQAQVQVPDVSLLSEVEATRILEEHGLKMDEVTLEASDEVDQGLVIKTIPGKGSSVREGAGIDLVVSEGQGSYKIEDYTGQAIKQVRSRLEEAGFTVSVTYETNPSVATDHIISQNLRLGDYVPSQTTIHFVVNDGNSQEMRDITGYTAEEARAYATQAGLNLVITEEYHSTIGIGRIFNQSIRPGSAIIPGSQLDVVISLGPRSTAPTPTLTPKEETPTPAPTPKEEEETPTAAPEETDTKTPNKPETPTESVPDNEAPADSTPETPTENNETPTTTSSLPSTVTTSSLPSNIVNN